MNTPDYYEYDRTDEDRTVEIPLEDILAYCALMQLFAPPEREDMP
jgi:hypothetical protein